MTVAIQALASHHIPVILEACADWQELAQYGPPYWRPQSEAELKRKIASTSGPQVSTEYNFVLTGPDGRLVGECSLHAIDWRNRLAQIGVCIWSPEDRRHGYGKQAVGFCIDWAMSYLGLYRLEAWILDSNEPSCRLFERLGFGLEGTLRQRYMVSGRRRSMRIYAKLALDK